MASQLTAWMYHPMSVVECQSAWCRHHGLYVNDPSRTSIVLMIGQPWVTSGPTRWRRVTPTNRAIGFFNFQWPWCGSRREKYFGFTYESCDETSTQGVRAFNPTFQQGPLW